MALSDMLGDHRFEIYTDIYGDVLNSDLTVQYWLLPFRLDWGFTFFQFRETPYYSYTFVEERMNRGGQVMTAYPFDKFTRIELGATGYASEVSFWNWYEPHQTFYRDSTRWERIFYGEAAFVFDNTYWTWQGPARGTRVRAGVDGSFLSDREFYDAYVDFRNYQRIGRRAVFATRVFGLGGFGRNADRYYIGGEAVRGYNYWEFYDDAGPVVGLANFELRMPFIDRLTIAAPLPMELGGIRGVAFLDAGWVMQDTMRFWNADSNRLQDLKVGVGAGVRIRLSYFSIMLDWAYPLSVTEDKGWKFHFGLGTEY